MRKKSAPPDPRHPGNQIRDFIDDEKSLGRVKKGQIAAAIGIRPSHFSNLLNGRNEWKLTHLQKLAEYLGVPLARLFEERGGEAETASRGEEKVTFPEEEIVRIVRTEARSLRGALREDLAALLRERDADRREFTGDGEAGAGTPVSYTDRPADGPVVRPVQIGEFDAGYDMPATDPATAPETLWFGRDWLRRQGLDSARCLVVRVQGDSMEPTLPEDCWVLVNRDQRRRRTGRIYALRTAQGLVVKRAARNRRGWLLTSDHPDREAVAWPEDAEIIGEVRWMARTF